MDFVLIVFGILFLLAGILGCILPFLPGPPLNYISLLLLHFTQKYQFTTEFLIFWAVVTIIIYGLDFFIPVWGTKKFGGSKRGAWGSMIGLLIGLIFFPPFGMIIGAFAGAVIGELTGGQDSNAALKAGFGSFIGFIAGTILKLIASGMMTWYFVKEIVTG